jgi:hypothetical protein
MTCSRSVFASRSALAGCLAALLVASAAAPFARADAAAPQEARRLVEIPVAGAAMSTARITVRPSLLRQKLPNAATVEYFDALGNRLPDPNPAHDGRPVSTLAAPSSGDAVQRGPGCPQVTVTHTDANFDGGTFNAQAGFAQGEIAAAQYTVAAPNTFPIRFDRSEIIFVTSNATVQTVTRWSIFIWDGAPNNGTLVFNIDADDVILPFIRVGPGTAGTNVQFLIDPNDPEQIFINNASGTGTFTVGYRIDQHNNQIQNPCFIAPPSASNAFPTTDVSGLSQPSRNWLFGLNCGSFGCPPNGGWVTFGNLASFCRPSGDWVLRAFYSSVNCAPVTGSCCLPNGTCNVVAQGQCSGGTFAVGGVCIPNTCPQPTGACCFPATNGCLVLDSLACTTNGGTYLGNGVACGAANTCPTGACCLPNGTCIGPVTAAACTAQNGTYRGNGSLCSAQNCPQPSGACCTPAGGCLSLTQAQCSIIPGNWLGFGTVCSPSPCTPATGACCAGVTCSITTSANCTGANRAFKGAGTVCNTAGANTAPCCRADFTQNALREPADIFAFLNAYFSTDAALRDLTDWDANAQNTPSDIFSYLNAYFAGGCP